MNTEEYLQALKEALSGYPVSLAEEIIDDFNEYYYAAKSEGFTDGDIIKGFGSIEEVISSIDSDKEKASITSEKDMYFPDKNIGVIQHNGNRNLEVVISKFFCGDLFFEPSDNNLEVEVVRDGRNFTLGNLLSSLGIKKEKTEKKSNFHYNVSDLENRTVIDLRSIDNGSCNDTVAIRVPLFYRSIEVAGTTIDMDFSDLTTSINAKTLTGDISVINCLGEKLNIATIAGDVNLDNVEFKEILQETKSGDIQINSGRTNKISLKSLAGDIKMENFNCVDYQINSTSGDIRLECGDWIRNLYIKTTAGDVDLSLPKLNYYLQTKTLAGDVSVDDELNITTKEAFAEAILTIITKAGDIDLNTLD